MQAVHSLLHLIDAGNREHLCSFVGNEKNFPAVLVAVEKHLSNEMSIDLLTLILQSQDKSRKSDSASLTPTIVNLLRRLANQRGHTDSVEQAQTLTGSSKYITFVALCVSNLNIVSSAVSRKILVAALFALGCPVSYELTKLCPGKYLQAFIADLLQAIPLPSNDTITKFVVDTVCFDNNNDIRTATEIATRAAVMVGVLQYCLHANNNSCLVLWDEIWLFIGTKPRSSPLKKLVIKIDFCNIASF